MHLRKNSTDPDHKLGEILWRKENKKRGHAITNQVNSQERERERER